MGRLELTGPDREALMNRVFSGRTAKLDFGRAKYGFLLNEDGYPIDDVLVYRAEEVVHVVINATGRDTDPAWIVRAEREERLRRRRRRIVSDEQAMIALQGPASEMTLQPLCGADLSALRYYGFLTAPVCGVHCLIARTGYTGEDGFELFFPKAHAREIWDALLGSGRSLEIGPIGLGARDTLRLEAGMPLYGQEINLEINPLEADLDVRSRPEDGTARSAFPPSRPSGRRASSARRLARRPTAAAWLGRAARSTGATRRWDSSPAGPAARPSERTWRAPS